MILLSIFLILRNTYYKILNRQIRSSIYKPTSISRWIAYGIKCIHLILAKQLFPSFLSSNCGIAEKNWNFKDILGSLNFHLITHISVTSWCAFGRVLYGRVLYGKEDYRDLFCRVQGVKWLRTFGSGLSRTSNSNFLMHEFTRVSSSMEYAFPER
jgi:hypothetical protein